MILERALRRSAEERASTEVLLLFTLVFYVIYVLVLWQSLSTVNLVRLSPGIFLPVSYFGYWDFSAPVFRLRAAKRIAKRYGQDTALQRMEATRALRWGGRLLPGLFAIALFVAVYVLLLPESIYSDEVSGLEMYFSYVPFVAAGLVAAIYERTAAYTRRLERREAKYLGLLDSVGVPTGD